MESQLLDSEQAHGALEVHMLECTLHPNPPMEVNMLRVGSREARLEALLHQRQRALLEALVSPTLIPTPTLTLVATVIPTVPKLNRTIRGRGWPARHESEGG